MSEEVLKTKNDPNFGEQVQARLHEIYVENLAYAEGVQDRGFREALAARKAAESQVENDSRMRAIHNARRDAKQDEEARFGQHPWGLKYLEQELSPQAAYDRAAERIVQETVVDSDDLVHEREEALTREMNQARELTLAIGEITATKLKEHGVEPDTIVGIQHVEEVKKISGESFRLKGKLRAEVPEIHYEEENDGKPHAWKLPISGQLDELATVLLNEDGSIFTAYGRFDEGDEEKDEPNRLSIRPNRAASKEKQGRLPIINRPEPTPIRQETYISRLDERLESDIGMANLPTNAAVSKAHIVLSRERAMQEAIVSLLIDNGISLEDEHNNTEVIEELSDEEKERRNQGEEYDDPRLTEEKVEVLRGPAHLVAEPDIIEIMDYVTSKKEGGDLNHYFRYREKGGDIKYATLDKFVWSHMPEERREELREAGLDPNELEVGRHPILKPSW